MDGQQYAPRVYPVPVVPAGTKPTPPPRGEVMERRKTQDFPHPAPTPSVDGEMSDEMVRVYWYDHACEWVTKYCDEHHRRSALVQKQALEAIPERPAE